MSPFTSLVAKDIHVNRRTLTTIIVAGFASLGLCLTGPVGLGIGALACLSGLIAFGCVLAMGISKERTSGSLLFTLSLPVSSRGYLAARAAGALLTYFLAWLPIVSAMLVVVLLSPLLPHGMASFALLLCGFLAAEFCLLVGVALLTHNEGALTGTMIVTNTAVTLFWWGMAAMPSVAAAMRSPVVIWDRSMTAVLAAEVLLSVLVVCLPIHLGARKSPL